MSKNLSKHNIEDIVTKNNKCYFILNTLGLLMFFLVVPLVELGVGAVYLHTTICTVHGINGTKVLVAEGVFSILYLMCFLTHVFIKPFSSQKSLFQNLANSHFVFKIITFVHCSLLLLFMILEFTFLNGCSDLTQRVGAGLWLAALNTLFAMLYVIYKLLGKLLC